MPKLSVIVPVYNTSKYLDRCISSILSQSFQNIELILVDDGSTDGSGALCDEWKKQDLRVRVIHQANSGVSAARNAGIRAAEGEYLAFVDSDDAVGAEWLETVMQKIGNKKCDIISFGLFQIVGGKVIRTQVMEDFYAPDRKSLLPRLAVYYERLFGSCCMKIYRTNFVRKNKLYFDESLQINEDAFFDYAALPLAEGFLNVGRPFYQYYYYKSSSSNRGRKDILRTFERRSKAHAEFLAVMQATRSGLPSAEEVLETGVHAQYLQAVSVSSKFSYCDRLEILREIFAQKKYRTMLKNKLKQEKTTPEVILSLFSVTLNCPAMLAFASSLKHRITERSRRND